MQNKLRNFMKFSYQDIKSKDFFNLLKSAGRRISWATRLRSSFVVASPKPDDILLETLFNFLYNRYIIMRVAEVNNNVWLRVAPNDMRNSSRHFLNFYSLIFFLVIYILFSITLISSDCLKFFFKYKS